MADKCVGLAAAAKVVVMINKKVFDQRQSPVSCMNPSFNPPAKPLQSASLDKGHPDSCTDDEYLY